MAERWWTGGCHCGAVRFRVRAPADPAAFEAVVCNCSMCTKKALIHLIVSPDRFSLLTSPAALQTYTFGTHTARHTFCGTCGIHPFYTPRSHPNSVDVNVRCLDDVDLSRVQAQAFNGRAWESHIHELKPEPDAPTARPTEAPDA